MSKNMQSWRYAASRNSDGAGNISWNVRELYEQEPGKPPAYTANGIGPYGETLQELRHDLRLMYADVLREDLPILDLTHEEPVLVPQEVKEEGPGMEHGRAAADSAPREQASLRKLRATDAGDVLRAFEPGTDMERQGSVGSPQEAEHYVATLLDPGARRHPWAIVVQDRLVGLVCVNVDAANRSGWFWYWMGSETRGRGWTSRAAAAVANWALSALELERLELGHRVNNPASGKVACSAGFIREGTERAKFLVDGRRIDVATYGRLATDPWPSTTGLSLSGES